MNARVNGQDVQVPDGISVRSLLLKKKMELKGIVIELNGEILPPEQWSQTLLKADDRLEIVSFVGGG
jgi:sulfur carrier protein